MPFPYQTNVLAKTLSIDVADEEEEHKISINSVRLEVEQNQLVGVFE